MKYRVFTPQDHTITGAMTTACMYRAVMGAAFDRLALPIRDFHDRTGQHAFEGQVQVSAPASLLAKALAVLLGTPLKAVQGPIRFEVDAGADEEVWTRFFPGKTMRSVLQKSGNRMVERLGAAQLTFVLQEVDGALDMQLERLRFLGIACPICLRPDITARETGEAGQLHFEIHASLPVIGLVASYTGYLDIPKKDLK